MNKSKNIVKKCQTKNEALMEAVDITKKQNEKHDILLELNYYTRKITKYELVTLVCKHVDGTFEKFQVSVYVVSKDFIVGKIEDHLKQKINGLDYNDNIKFTKSNIYDILEQVDVDMFNLHRF